MSVQLRSSRLALYLSFLLLLLRGSGALEEVTTSAGSGDGVKSIPSSDTGEVTIEGFMEEIRQAMNSQWEILQNIRYHTLATKVRVTQLETQVKKLAAKVVNDSEPALHTFGSDTAKPAFYSSLGKTKPCESTGPDADGGVSLLVEAMKELSANYNRLLNSSVLSGNDAITFEEDFNRLAEIANRVKDLSGATATPPSPGDGESGVGVITIGSAGVKNETWSASGVEDVRRPAGVQEEVQTGRPGIVEGSSRNMTVRAGDTATLTCHVNNLGDAIVTWVRSRDTSIVAVGSYVYIPISRYQVVHQVGSADHHLRIHHVQEVDQGAYECQVSVKPLVTHKIWLTVKGMDEYEEVVAGIPNFVESSSPNVTVRAGETATLNCRVYNLGDNTVFWYRDKDLTLLSDGTDTYVADERFRVVHDEGADDWMLQIMGVSVSDAGWYECVVVFPFPVKQRVYLAVVGSLAPATREARILTEGSSSNVTVLEGDSATFTCRVQDLGTNTVTWTRRQDLHILTAGQYTFSPDDRFSAFHEGEDWGLQIIDVNKEDEGEYECLVSTSPPTTRIFFLKVVELLVASRKPVVADSNEDVAVVKGDTATLTCPFQDLSTYFVTWVRRRDMHLLVLEGYVATTDERFSVHQQDQSGYSKLQIKVVNEQDEGDYECEISTDPPTTRVIHLRVEDDSRNPANTNPIWPKIEEAPTDVHTVEGKTVTFTCRASGQGQPIITWMKNGLHMTYGHHQVTKDGDLLIRDVRLSDEGRYLCNATNRYGSVGSSAQLKVEHATKIVKAPKHRHRMKGESAVFRCKAVADSDLELSVEWLVNGEVIDYDKNPRLMRLPKNALMVSSVMDEDAGVYTCLASTPLDRATANATLTLKGTEKNSQVPTGARVLTTVEDDPCPPLYQMLGDNHTLCILIVTDQKLSWREASEYCREEGGDLAWEAENVHLRTFLEERHGLTAYPFTQWPFWVGARENRENGSDNVRKGGGSSSSGTGNKGGGSRSSRKGGSGGGGSSKGSSGSSVWRWVDGTRVSLADVWARGQPRHYGHVVSPDGVCMVLDGYVGYRATALPCHFRRRFLCRRIT